MALQSTGELRLSDIQGEFGGSSPIKLSEYYRGGGLVPETETVDNTVREPSSGYNYNQNTTDWTIDTYDGSVLVRWGGSNIKRYDSSDPASVENISAGGWTYHKGPYQEEITEQLDPPYGPTITIQYHSLYREQGSTTTEPINESVPKSGELRINDFYGTENA